MFLTQWKCVPLSLCTLPLFRYRPSALTMGLVYDCIPLLIVLWFRALESPGLSLLGLSEVPAENMHGSSTRLKNMIVYQKNTLFFFCSVLGFRPFTCAVEPAHKYTPHECGCSWPVVHGINHVDDFGQVFALTSILFVSKKCI